MRMGVKGTAVAVGLVGLLLSAGACSGPSAPASPAGNDTVPAAAGTPEPTRAPATQDAPLRAGEHFTTIGLARSFTPVPPAGGTDLYRCFLIDPHITTASYLVGSQFMPQNGAIVHHAIIYRVPAGDVATARAVDAGEPGDGWTCFGGDGVGSGGSFGGGGWVGSWAPGAHETLLGDNLGFAMEPGSGLVMQIHYNLLATNGRPGESDQSRMRLRLTTSTSVKPLQTMLVPGPIELPCTSAESGPLCDRTAALDDLRKRFGQEAVSMVNGLNYLCNKGKAPTPGVTQSCEIPVRRSGTIYSVAGHMHLLGKSISVTINPGKPGAKTLLDLPVFNFDDQGQRPLVTPVAVKTGDTVKVTCTYDASLRGKLPQLKNLKPRYVMWGDGTSDEMCLGIIYWTLG